MSVFKYLNKSNLFFFEKKKHPINTCPNFEMKLKKKRKKIII